MRLAKYAVTYLAVILAMVAALTLTFLASYTAVYHIMKLAPQENSKRISETVYAVCERSRAVANGELERACGDAQDRSGTEYLCHQDGTVCWVEVK